MHIQESIQNQFFAALEMLKNAVVQCPPSHWDDAQSPKKFWHVAYHTLFYTHLYLQTSGESFTAWPKHRAEYHDMDAASRTATPLVAYSKEEILEYLAFCRREVAKKTANLDLDAESGFSWLPFNKMELQIYNIRHIQHHAAELAEWLGANAGIQLNWVGSKPASENA